MPTGRDGVRFRGKTGSHRRMGKPTRLTLNGPRAGTYRTCHATLTMSVDRGIVLKKSFWGDDQNFSGPLMPFARGDMRDHIASRKNDHGAPYGRYAVLRRWSQLKMSFCEIFSVVQFSTFATLSPRKRTPSRPVGMSQKCHERRSGLLLMGRSMDHQL